jgi:hypothetical protein
MKRYLWIGGLVLAINAYSTENPFDFINGEENPFDLAKNMQKIEAGDTALLNTLEDEIQHTDQRTLKQTKEKLQQVTVKITPPTENLQPKKVQQKPKTTKQPQHKEQKTIQHKPKQTTPKAPKPSTPSVAPRLSETPKPSETPKISKSKKPIKAQQKSKLSQEQVTQKLFKAIEELKHTQKIPHKIKHIKQYKINSIDDINPKKEKLIKKMQAQEELQKAIHDVDQED